MKLSNKSKTIWKWIGEAILVFGSVLGAFVVEDYRQERSDKSEYIHSLINLRNELELTAMAKSADADSSKSMHYQFLMTYKKADSIVNDENIDNDTVAFRLVFSTWVPVGKTLEMYYLQDLNNFSKFLIEDNLSTMVLRYREMADNPTKYAFADFKERVRIELEKQFDLYNYSNSMNNNLNRTYLKNIIKASVSYQESSFHSARYTANRMNGMVSEIDEVLYKHGVDTAALSGWDLVSK